MDGQLQSLTPVVAGRKRVFSCHSATLSGRFPPNSLAAVAECVAARVPRLEIDVRFMADDSAVIFHDDHLDRDATGTGSLASMTRGDLDAVRYRSDERHELCFLEDVVEALRQSSTVLQVDLKLTRPISRARVDVLQRLLAPLRERLIVGSQAHWNLRPLEGLPVAFDPTWQLQRDNGERGPGHIPRTLGRHGLWDDSPYATNPHFSATQYLEIRLEDVRRLLPDAVEWMVDIETITHIDSLGVRLGEWLAARDCQLAAWTVRPAMADPVGTTRRMFELGATTVITDCAALLAAGLAE